MSYNGIGFVNNNPPAINAENLNKMDNELIGLDNLVNVMTPSYIFNAPRGTQYFPITITAWDEYIITNNTGNVINAYTFSATSSSGTVVETISTNIASGESVKFLAHQNAVAIRSYVNVAGIIIVNNISKGIIGEISDKFTDYVRIGGKEQVDERNTTFFTQSEDLYDVKSTVDDYRINQAGTDVYSASGYNTTDYIDVSGLTSVKLWFWTGNAVVSMAGDYVLYDINKTPLGLRAGTQGEINVNGAKYVRISISKNNKNGAMLIKGTITPTSYIPYGFVFDYSDNLLVTIYPDDDVIQKLYDNKGKNIYFAAGTYDIISIYKAKFGNSYFDDYVDYSSGGNNIGRGLPVYHGTKMLFDSGAVFTANYSGNNANVRKNFSAFAFETGVIFDGLRMTASGIRNIIHDDFDNSTSGTTIIQNCNLTHDAKIIAGGLAKHETVIIKDNLFNNTALSAVYDFSYHNNSESGAQSILIIKDNYMKHAPSIRYYGASELLSDVLISNNSLGNEVDYGPENVSSLIENIDLKTWNNSIRNS